MLIISSLRVKYYVGKRERVFDQQIVRWQVIVNPNEYAIILAN